MEGAAFQLSYAGEPVSRDLHFDIEQFLFREARLLDQECYQDWLALLAEDIRYRLPMRENRYRKDPRGALNDQDTFIYNDTLKDLRDRVARLETGIVWAEDPPLRIRRLITNVIAETTDKPDTFYVTSNFLVYRNRRQRDEAWLVGAREDYLHKVGHGFQIANRMIWLDQHVALDKNLYFFI